MSRESQLIKNTTLIAIGNICTKFLSFFLLPLYTALLSTEEYGRVDLIQTYITLILYVVTLQLDSGVFRYLIDVRNDESEQRKYITSTVVVSIRNLVLYTVMMVIIFQFVNIEYGYFLIWNVISISISGLFLQITRGLGDTLAYAVMSTVSGGTTLLCNVLFVAYFRTDGAGLLLATCVGNIVSAVILFFYKRLYKYIRISDYSKEKVHVLLKYSLPTIPSSLSWWVVNVADRSIVTFVLGSSANGIYSIANKFPSIFSMVSNVFITAWTESASIAVRDGNKDNYYTKVINTSINVFCAICTVLIATLPFLFTFLVKGDFAIAYNYIPILLTGGLFHLIAGLYGSLYNAFFVTSKLAKTTIYAAILDVVINVALINTIGLYAAAISTAAAYFLIMIYRACDIRKYAHIRIRKRDILVNMVAMGIAIFSYFIENRVINICLLLVCTVIVILLNRQIFIMLVCRVKKNILYR